MQQCENFNKINVFFNKRFVEKNTKSAEMFFSTKNVFFNKRRHIPPTKLAIARRTIGTYPQRVVTEWSATGSWLVVSNRAPLVPTTHPTV